MKKKENQLGNARESKHLAIQISHGPNMKETQRSHNFKQWMDCRNLDACCIFLCVAQVIDPGLPFFLFEFSHNVRFSSEQSVQNHSKVFWFLHF